MLKINIFSILGLLVLFVALFIMKAPNKSEVNKPRKIIFTDETKETEASEKENRLKRVSFSKPDKSHFDKDEIGAKVIQKSEVARNQTSKNENRNLKAQAKNKSKVEYATTEDVMESLFPNLKEKVGQEKYDEFITSFPFDIVKLIPESLTPSQKEKYEKIKKTMLKDFEINIPDFELSSEEIDRRANEIKRHYIPKVINLLTKTQQKQFVKKFDEIFFSEEE